MKDGGCSANSNTTTVDCVDNAQRRFNIKYSNLNESNRIKAITFFNEE